MKPEQRWIRARYAWQYEKLPPIEMNPRPTPSLAKHAAEMKGARGHVLDRLAAVYGLRRQRRWWLFREWDRTLRRRVLDHARGVNRRSCIPWPVSSTQPWEEDPLELDVAPWETVLAILMMLGCIVAAFYQ